MKKTLLYSLAALASMTLAGCAGDYDDWADPQSYPQEDAAAQYGVTISAGSEATVTMPDADGTVHLVTLSSSNEAISGYSVNSVTIGGEAVEASVVDNDVTVDATTLAKLVDKLYNSRAAVAHTMDVVTDMSINLSNGDAVTGVTGTTTVTVTPASVPAVDPQGYYLLGDFVGNGWDTTQPLWMEDQGDGTYKLAVETTGDTSYWAVYMGSHYVSGSWDDINQGKLGSEVNGDTEQNGLLAYVNDPIYDEPQSMAISGKGRYEITIDVNNLTYSVVRAESKYYLVGALNGWSGTTANMFYTQGGNTYTYTTQWTGDHNLKFWDANGINNWDTAWGSQTDGDESESGSLVNTDAGAIKAPTADEYYTFTVDMNTQTYMWTKLDNQSPTTYTYISLIGDFNSWGGDVDMTEVSPHNWYLEYTVPSDGGLKFRADHAWDTSWGTSDKETAIGDVYYLPLGSENINVPAGTYEFYLNDITGEWNIVKK